MKSSEHIIPVDKYHPSPRFITIEHKDVVYEPVVHFPMRVVTADIACGLRFHGASASAFVVGLYTAGTGIVRMDGQTAEFGPGSLITTAPTKDYDCFQTVSPDLRFLSLTFGLRDANGGYCDAPLHEVLSTWANERLPTPALVTPLSSAAARNCQAILDELAACFLPGNKLRILAMNCALHRLFEFLAMSAWRQHPRANEATACMEMIRREIEESIDTHLSLEDLAEQAGMSQQHLCRRFRAVYGTTPIAYLQELRMQHATQLLSRSTLRIGEIASQCGYQSPYHFSRMFRIVHGVSPKQFRRQAND